MLVWWIDKIGADVAFPHAREWLCGPGVSSTLGQLVDAMLDIVSIGRVDRRSIKDSVRLGLSIVRHWLLAREIEVRRAAATCKYTYN